MRPSIILPHARVALLPFCLLALLPWWLEGQAPSGGEVRASAVWTGWVDPLIGTDRAATARVQGHGTEPLAQVIPGVGRPNGMTQWTPQTRATEKKCLAPYYYGDTKLSGFRGTHWLNGSCVQDYGSFTVMPLARGGGPFDADSRATPFGHEVETARVESYTVYLPEPDITARLTATRRCGLLEFEFPAGAEPVILFEPNSDEAEGRVEVRPELGQVAAENPVHRIYQGWGEPAGFSGHAVAEFDAPMAGWGTYDAGGPQAGARLGEKRPGLGAYVRFAPGTRRVRVRVGTSFTSGANAEKNLRAEIPDWDFARVEAEQQAAWNGILERVRVEGGTEEDRKMFYTALYHAFQHPRLFSDVDGSYPGFAGNAATERAVGFDYYDDFSAWDTFRAVHPLYNLLAPEKSRDFLQSLTAKARQGGWMPIFPCWNSYTAAMIGDHLVSLFADAVVKGVEVPGMEEAWAYLEQNAWKTPEDPQVYRDGKGRRALDSYLKHGYIPEENGVPDAFHQREQVSRTLEYAYNDFCLAQIAERLGKPAQAAELRKRAGNYRNVYDPAVGWVRGRHEDGRWAEVFEPDGKMSYITEGTPRHYTWFVPHDVAGLAGLMGGEAAMSARLDAFFGEGAHWHGNEPCHHTYWLYNYLGEPWKTQALVRQILREEYHAGPGGISGNEDSGQMSAWLVFAAMGFYPVCPGTDAYALHGPLFPAVEIRPPGRSPFRVEASGQAEDAPYIASAEWQGEAFGRSFLRHQELNTGGVLRLVMSREPNRGWAAGVPAGPGPEKKLVPGTNLWGVQFNPLAPHNGVEAGSWKAGEMAARVERLVGEVAALGAGWVRLSVDWQNVEDGTGRYDWSWVDQSVEGLTGRGVGILLCLNGGHPRHTAAKSVRGEAERAAWREWARAATVRYGARVRHWEIWNEPNMGSFWKPEPNAADFAELVKVAAEEIRKNVPGAVVAGGSLARLDLPFAQELVRLGAAEALDVLTFHPYGEMPEAILRPVRVPVLTPHRYLEADHPVASLRALLEPAGVKVWQAECGYPASANSTGWTGNGPWGETIQAKWLLRRLLTDLAGGSVGSGYFCLVDYLDGSGGKFNSKGLLRLGTMERKPAFGAFQRLARLLPGPVEVRVAGPGRIARMGAPGSFPGVKPEDLVVLEIRQAGRTILAWWIPWRAQELSAAGTLVLRGEAPAAGQVVDPLTGAVTAPGQDPETGGWVVPVADYPMFWLGR